MEEKKQICLDENEYRGIKRGQAAKDAVDKVKNSALVAGCGDMASSTISGYKVMGNTIFRNMGSWLGAMILGILWPIKWTMFFLFFIPTGMRRCHDYETSEFGYTVYDSTEFSSFGELIECIFGCRGNIFAGAIFAAFSFLTFVGFAAALYLSLPVLHASMVTSAIGLLNISSLAYEIGRFEKEGAGSDKDEVAS